MVQQTTLKPEELFYLAKKCGATHLDYDYIRMMPDIEQRASVIEDEIIKSLESRKIVQDSWGDISINEEFVELLSPIWDGEFESTASMRKTENDEVYGITFFLHKKDDECRFVYSDNEGLHVSIADEGYPEMIATALMPDNYDNNTCDGVIEQGEEENGVILFKNVNVVSDAADILKLYLVNDLICDKVEGGYKIVNAVDYMHAATTILKGE